MRSRGREQAERVTPRRVSLGVLPRVAVRLQQGRCVWPPEASEAGPRASRMHGPPAASAPSAARSAGVPAPRVAAGAGGTAPACTTSARRPATRTSTCRRARSTAALAASSSMTWRPARRAAWTPRRCVAARLAVLWSGHDALPAGGGRARRRGGALLRALPCSVPQALQTRCGELSLPCCLREC